LRHDGFEWRWTALDKKIPPLIRQTTPGKLPPFIVSPLPEGWLESVLKDKDECAALRSGKRYMSNITIVENEAELKTLPEDVLKTRLVQYSKHSSADRDRSTANSGPDLAPHFTSPNLFNRRLINCGPGFSSP
jgi:serine/threonine-protein kinase HipA